MILEPRQLGSILGVWAHPDDEVYLSGALMATAVDDGRRVVCVTATKGEAGFPDDDHRTVGERQALRASECAACLDILGVTEHHWLDYPDGGCHLVDPAEPVAKLTALIDEIQPDTILTFGPDGMTGHDDHMAVSRWTTLAARLAGRTSAAGHLLYATKTPDWNQRFNAHIDLNAIMMVEGMDPPAVNPGELAVGFLPEGPLLERKLQALHAQASQIEPLYQAVGEAAFGDLAAEEFFRFARTEDWPGLIP
jgi:LmbE family N-acetylglucosaminyl deacetylase